jgi:hypothetical protein
MHCEGQMLLPRASPKRLDDLFSAPFPGSGMPCSTSTILFVSCRTPRFYNTSSDELRLHSRGQAPPAYSDRIGAYSFASQARDFAVFLAFAWMAANLSAYMSAFEGLLIEQAEILIKAATSSLYWWTSWFPIVIRHYWALPVPWILVSSQQHAYKRSMAPLADTFRNRRITSLGTERGICIKRLLCIMRV